MRTLRSINKIWPLFVLIGFCSCTIEDSLEIQVYNDIFPQLIELQPNLKPFYSPPYFNLNEDEMESGEDLYEIEDSILRNDKSNWEARLKMDGITIFLNDTLIPIDTSFFFLNILNSVLVSEGNSELLNSFQNTSKHPLKVSLTNFDSIPGYNLLTKGKDDTSSEFVLGEIQFSRVYFDNNKDKACFGVFFNSANGLLQFESFIITHYNGNCWEIIESI